MPASPTLGSLPLPISLPQSLARATINCRSNLHATSYLSPLGRPTLQLTLHSRRSQVLLKISLSFALLPRRPRDVIYFFTTLNALPIMKVATEKDLQALGAVPTV